MKILFITHFFPPRHNAGTENYTLGLAKAIITRGHEILVLCAEDWVNGSVYWNGVSQDIYQGVSVHRIHLNWLKADIPNRTLYDSLKVEIWLDQFLNAIKPDIVHVTSANSLGVGILRSIKRNGIPVVLTLTDFWFICQRTNLLKSDFLLCDGVKTAEECQDCLLSFTRIYPATKRLFSARLNRFIWDYVCQSPLLSGFRSFRGSAVDMKYRQKVMVEVADIPDIVISPSKFVQHVFSNAGYPREIIYNPHGHDLRWLGRYEGQRSSHIMRFGYMGQITTIKGVHILVKAFKDVESVGGVKLDLWGDIKKDQLYVSGLKSLIGKSEKIALRGRFERADIAQVLSEIDVLVVPSLWYENAPLVIAEAFAAKIPVIASNIGGMAEAVTHEKNGLLFEVGSVEDLAAQMRRILQEPGLLEKLRQGIEPVKTFTQEVNELEQIYQELVSR